MKFTLATVFLCVAAAAAFPAPGEEDAASKKQEKRGVLGLGLPSYSSLSFAHAPIALPAPAIHAAPIALPALPAIHAAPIALPAPAIHAAPIALPAPAIHAPIALPAIAAAPAIKTIAAPIALPSLSLSKIW